MTECYISLPGLFSSGDAKHWFQKFEICVMANEWKEEDRVIKLPVLLEGEALAVWLELVVEQQKNYSVIKKEIQNVIMLKKLLKIAIF